MQKYLTSLQPILTSPYTGWVLMNILVWSLALYVVALSIRAFGVVGAPIGTSLAGLIVGIGQGWILRRMLPIEPRRWIGYSFIGTVLGVLPIALLVVWVFLVAIVGLNTVLFILGAIFGGVLGASQAVVLYPIADDTVIWWVVINILAGGLCAPLSLTGTSVWLPVFCSLGPVTFGILTALALRYAIRSWDADLKD